MEEGRDNSMADYSDKSSFKEQQESYKVSTPGECQCKPSFSPSPLGEQLVNTNIDFTRSKSPPFCNYKESLPFYYTQDSPSNVEAKSSLFHGFPSNGCINETGFFHSYPVPNQNITRSIIDVDSTIIQDSVINNKSKDE